MTLLTDPDEIIAKVQAPRIEIEEEPVVAEGEELEGEEAEGEGAEGESPVWRGRIRGDTRRGLTQPCAAIAGPSSGPRAPSAPLRAVRAAPDAPVLMTLSATAPDDALRRRDIDQNVATVPEPTDREGSYERHPCAPSRRRPPGRTDGQ